MSEKPMAVKLGHIAYWVMSGCIFSFIFAYIFQLAIIAIPAVVIFFLCGFYLCLAESEMQGYSWKCRRERWLLGGYDPAYPKEIPKHLKKEWKPNVHKDSQGRHANKVV